MRTSTIAIARWTARVLGTLLLVLVVLFAISEGVPNPFHQPLAVNLISLGMVMMLTGLLAAWKWEGVGGFLVVAGWILVVIVNRGFRPNGIFEAFLIVGILHVLCWWKSRDSSHSVS
jgi:hypothetical protein